MYGQIELITREGWQRYLTMCSPHVFGFDFATPSPGVVAVTVYLERAYFEAHAEAYLKHLRATCDYFKPMMYSVEIKALPAIENKLLDDAKQKAIQ